MTEIMAAMLFMKERDTARARTEELEALLKKWDALIKHQYTGSSEAMSDMHACAQETAKLLYGSVAARNGENG